MKIPIQVEIRVFVFSNTPILQYSSNPKNLVIFTGNPATGWTDLVRRTRFALFNQFRQATSQ